jgi:tetratricopeptide (TPR) repeat protein
MLLPILSIFIIVTIYIAIRRHSAMDQEQELFDDFRNREQEANWVRKQDISDLAYIKLPEDVLPLGRFDDEELQSFEQTLRELSTQPICNLNGISNTDLKLRYGVANLSLLSQCDTNYSTLIAVLANYGEKLYELSHPEDAMQVLEYALSLGSDVGKTYEILALLYEQTGHPEKIERLRQAAENLNSIRRQSILRKLDTRPQEHIQTDDAQEAEV